jgi:DNA invertase Pin-like site-specific DNA recombinase
MLIGYARISTIDQTLALQEDALRAAGCDRIFNDVASGVADARPGLAEAIAFLRGGDTLVVWKLDRLGRSLRHLIDTVNGLSSRGTGIRSLQESIDTNTPGGKLVFHVFGALAEFERELIVERTQAGLKAARARGRKGGRPGKMDAKKLEMAKTLMADPTNSVAEVCQSLQVSRATLYRSIRKGFMKQAIADQPA